MSRLSHVDTAPERQALFLAACVVLIFGFSIVDGEGLGTLFPGFVHPVHTFVHPVRASLSVLALRLVSEQWRRRRRRRP